MRVKFSVENVVARFQALSRKNTYKYGLPFLLMLFIGSFGLERFASLRYDFRKNELFKEENLAKFGVKKKKVTLEEEYEKIKQLDINSWENIRGPRPWEEPQQTEQKN